MEEARARPDVTSRCETGMFLSSANKALAVRFIKVFAHCRTTRGRFAAVPLRVSARPASIARMRAGSSSVRGQASAGGRLRTLCCRMDRCCRIDLQVLERTLYRHVDLRRANKNEGKRARDDDLSARFSSALRAEVGTPSRCVQGRREAAAVTSDRRRCKSRSWRQSARTCASGQPRPLDRAPDAEEGAAGGQINFD